MKKEILFRASSVGALMVGKHGLTERQQSRLDELKARDKASIKGEKGVRPLTQKMKEEVIELQAKKDAPFELSQTAKSYVKKVWLQKEFGFEEPVVNDVLLKGQMCEDDTISLVSKVFDIGEFRMKNKERFTNEFFTGTPDFVAKNIDLVEEYKTPWTIKTFVEKETIEAIYEAQVQVYLDLTGKTNLVLHYCLVDTPEELVHNAQKRLFYKYGSDENNPLFIEGAAKIEKAHKVSHLPVTERIYSRCFEKDEEFLEELKFRVTKAREYYKTLCLGDSASIEEATAFYGRFKDVF